MARGGKEWVGATDNAMPPPSVRLRIFEAYGECCYLCTCRLYAGRWDLDHIKELADGGENRESNLAPACRGCHRKKSAKNHSDRSAGKRSRMKQAGIKQPKRKIPYRRFDGTPVYRD